MRGYFKSILKVNFPDASLTLDALSQCDDKGFQKQLINKQSFRLNVKLTLTAQGVNPTKTIPQIKRKWHPLE